MRILVAGDFAPNYRIAAKLKERDYSCLDEIKPIIWKADYSIVNFESPVVTRKAKPIKKTGPSLRCTERAMECLAQAGFNCVTLANNHFRDYGQVGVEDTLAACDQYGLDHVGGGVNIAEAKQILYKNVDGQKLAIINICENEWSIAGKKHGGSAPINPVLNYYTIKEARKQADYVLVIVHGGIEGYRYPTPRMVDTYRFFVDAGADVVVNHHQHCYSGYEDYKGKHIFYGLGNFCIDRDKKKKNKWYEGYMVKIDLGGEGIKFEVIPYIQCDEKAAVVLMNGEERRSFDEKIKAINIVISSRKEIELQMAAIAQIAGKKRLAQLEPFKNKIVRKLQKKDILPSFLNENTLMIMNNIMRCESHRELLLSVFNNNPEES